MHSKRRARAESTRVALDGVSDIAEIATICARESGIEIVAIVDGKTNLDRFAGIPIARNYDAVADQIDGLIVTDLGVDARRPLGRRWRGSALSVLLLPSPPAKSESATVRRRYEYS